VKPGKKMPAQVLDVAEKVGGFIEYWGFKKIHGRVWTLIFLAGRPVDAAYLISHLRVSKALISITLKDLLQYNVILESSEEASTTHYVANNDITGVVLDVLMNREAKMLMEIKGACELLGRTPQEGLVPFVSEKRAANLISMAKSADELLQGLVALKTVEGESLNQLFQVEGAS
jgi:DNA-binding transcriptional regulator GbsR (MarR family)